MSRKSVAPPSLPAEDLALWHEVRKTARPLTEKKKKRVLPPPAPLLPAKKTDSVPTIRVTQPIRADKKPAPLSSPQLDRATAKKFQKGEMAIDARLDLHGLTEAQAHTRLNIFIENHAKKHHRMLLVITGKGRDGNGVLKKNLRQWLVLTPLAPLVLAVHQARPQHGGDGAFYILLKRQRSKVL